MEKVSAKEFIRIEIFTSLWQINLEDEKVSLKYIIDESINNIKITRDQVFELLTNEKSRQELHKIFSKLNIHNSQLYLMDLFDTDFLLKRVMYCIKCLIFSAFKEEFSNKEDFKMLTLYTTEKESKYATNENIKKVASKYFSVKTFKI